MLLLQDAGSIGDELGQNVVVHWVMGLLSLVYMYDTSTSLSTGFTCAISIR